VRVSLYRSWKVKCERRGNWPENRPRRPCENFHRAESVFFRTPST